MVSSVTGPEQAPHVPADEALREESDQPRLSMDFFQELLDLPACKTVSVCDNCGRCER